MNKSEKVSGGKLTEGQVLADTDHGEQLLFIVPGGQQVVEWLGKGRQLHIHLTCRVSSQPKGTVSLCGA